MKYHIFAGNRLYPGGGTEGYRGVFDTLEEAQQYVLNRKPDWAELVIVSEDGALKSIGYYPTTNGSESYPTWNMYDNS